MVGKTSIKDHIKKIKGGHSCLITVSQRTFKNETVISLKYLLLTPVSMRTGAAARNHVIRVLVRCRRRNLQISHLQTLGPVSTVLSEEEDFMVF